MSSLLVNERFSVGFSFFSKGFHEFVLRIRSFLLIFLFYQYLTESTYGLWVQINAALNILLPLVLLKLDEGIIRSVAKLGKGTAKRKLFSYSLFAVSVLIVLAITFSLFRGLIGDLMFADQITDSEKLLLVNYTIVYIFFKGIRRIILSNYKSSGMLTTYSLIEILHYLVEVSIGFVILSNDSATFTDFLSAILAIELIFSLLLLVVFQVQHGYQFESYNMSEYGDIMRFSLPLVPSTLFLFLAQFGDRFIILQFTDLSDVARYSVNYDFASLIKLFLVPISFVMLPQLYRFWDLGKLREFKLLFTIVIKIYSLSFGFVGLLILLFSKDIITLLAAAESSIFSIVLIIVLAQFFRGYFTLAEYFLFLEKKTITIMIYQFINMLILLSTGWILISSSGILGAAVATAISYLVMFLFSLKILNDQGMGLEIKYLYLPIISIIITVFSSYVFFDQVIIVKSILFVLLCGFQIGVIFKFKYLHPDEIRFIKRSIFNL